MKPVLSYGSETWTLAQGMDNDVNSFETKISRKCRPKQETNFDDCDGIMNSTKYIKILI